MIIRRMVIALMATLISMVAFATAVYIPAEREKTMATMPLQPAQVIQELLHQYPLIGLSDQHFTEGVIEVLIQIIQTPGVARQIDDIVVEFGNSRWQPLVDEYIAGKPVTLEAISVAWRDTLFFTAWTTPAYPRFFQAIRALNQTLPEQDRLRVVLAEEPFDWSTESPQRWEEKNKRRDKYYLRRIKEQVIDRGRKALLIFGAFHLIRQTLPGSNIKTPPLGQRLAEQWPDQSLVFWTDIRGASASGWRQQYLSEAETALITKQALKNLTFNEVSNRPVQSTMPLENLTDGLLLLPEQSRNMTFSDRLLQDSSWLEEIKCRGQMIGGSLERQVNKLLAFNLNRSDNPGNHCKT